jgi:hypothetical protein
MNAETLVTRGMLSGDAESMTVPPVDRGVVGQLFRYFLEIPKILYAFLRVGWWRSIPSKYYGSGDGW